MTDLAKKAFGEIYRMLREQRTAARDGAAARAEAYRIQLAARLADADVQTLHALLSALQEERDQLCADAFSEGFTLGVKLMTGLLTE